MCLRYNKSPMNPSKYTIFVLLILLSGLFPLSQVDYQPEGKRGTGVCYLGAPDGNPLVAALSPERTSPFLSKIFRFFSLSCFPQHLWTWNLRPGVCLIRILFSKESMRTFLPTLFNQGCLLTV